MGLLFRQLYDIESGTFTYLLADEENHEGVIIDSVYERHERDLALINELQINLRYAISLADQAANELPGRSLEG